MYDAKYLGLFSTCRAVRLSYISQKIKRHEAACNPRCECMSGCVWHSTLKVLCCQPACSWTDPKHSISWTYLLLSHIWPHVAHTYTLTHCVFDSTSRLSPENNHLLMSCSFPKLGGPTGPITEEENTTRQMAASWNHIKMERANSTCQQWN